MNTCVSDEQVVVNIQGIRHVTWGESTSLYSRDVGKPYYVTVTYKGTTSTFNYRSMTEARTLFTKIRIAMDKSYDKTN